MDLFEAIMARRDVRNEFTGERLTPAQLQQVLAAGHHAPSVGMSEPWDFVVIQDPARLEAFAAHVASCREDFAASLPPERQETFNPIKIEGIRESGTGIVVTYDPRRGGPQVLGRHTIANTGIMSVACCIQNMWLTATALGLGLGWVSFYRQEFLDEFIGAKAPVQAAAWLCLGPVSKLQEVPDLERFGWGKRRPVSAAIHYERLGEA